MEEYVQKKQSTFSQPKVKLQDNLVELNWGLANNYN